jgi:hypothetical protein
MEGMKKTLQSNNLTTITVSMLDPIGDVVEVWEVKGKIDNIDMGYLDWSNTEPVIITVYVDVYDVILQQLNHK